MKVVSPWRGEFGIRCYWHAPAVHAIPGEKVVCCERGTEALYPSADVVEVVERRFDGTRARNDYRRDLEHVEAVEARMRQKYPGAEIIRPDKSWPRERFVPRPLTTLGIECDVVVCPRRREYGHSKNWSHWPLLTRSLQAEGLTVYAGGAPDSSFEVPCGMAWEHERFLDATLEAMHSADLVIATDAGLAHLAVLAGRPLLMITYQNGIVAPGPNTDEHGRVTERGFWPVRMYRYREGNHTGSPLRVLRYAWEAPERVVLAAMEELTS